MSNTAGAASMLIGWGDPDRSGRHGHSRTARTRATSPDPAVSTSRLHLDPVLAVSATSRQERTARRCTTDLRATSPPTHARLVKASLDCVEDTQGGRVRLAIDQDIDFPPLASKRDAIGAEGDAEPVGEHARAGGVRYHDSHLHQALPQTRRPVGQGVRPAPNRSDPAAEGGFCARADRCGPWLLLLS